MKILYLTNSLIPSNNANSVHALKMCDCLSIKKNKVTLVCLSYAKNINFAKLKIEYNLSNIFNIIHYKKYNNKFGIFTYYINIIKLILKKKYDLFYFRHPFFLLLLLFRNKKSILELHDLRIFSKSFYKFLFKKLIKKKSLIRIIVISKQLKTDLVGIYPFIKYKIDIIPDAASTISFHEKKQPFLNNQYNFNLIYVGSFHKGKGLEIIEKLIPEFENYGFHIVGGQGKLFQYWINKLDKYNNVFMYGHIDHSSIADFISEADLCLLPNQENVKIYNSNNKFIEIGKYTSPLKLFEYMSMGKPIVASDLANLREILTNEYNSILCRSDSVSEWINAIQILYNNNDLRNKIGQNAKLDFEKNYTWGNRANKIFKIYEI